MASCKNCGKPEKEHAFGGIACVTQDNVFDDGTDEKERLKERRERIATKLMAGLLSNPAIIDCFGTCNLIAKEALEQTDALIKALDEVKE